MKLRRMKTFVCTSFVFIGDANTALPFKVYNAEKIAYIFVYFGKTKAWIKIIFARVILIILNLHPSSKFKTFLHKLNK